MESCPNCGAEASDQDVEEATCFVCGQNVKYFSDCECVESAWRDGGWEIDDDVQFCGTCSIVMLEKLESVDKLVDFANVYFSRH